jgi:Zn-dependent membrane protease YugP
VLGAGFLVNLGILLFAAVAFFQPVTLPVEFNASKRALETLSGSGMLSADELPGAKRVLSAAAMTYVAALALSLAQLLRMIMSVNRRRR